MNNELIKKARTFTAQHELADFYSAVAFSGYSHAIDKWNETLADFAAECVKDALALADAADNYCDRCGDIVQVNAIERAIRAEEGCGVEFLGTTQSYVSEIWSGRRRKEVSDDAI